MKNPKKPKKNPKNPKKTHWAGFFLKKPGFFPTLNELQAALNIYIPGFSRRAAEATATLFGFGLAPGLKVGCEGGRWAAKFPSCSIISVSGSEEN